MTAVAESAFGLFHGLVDGVEIVAGGDYGKEQDENTAERAHKDERPARRTVRRSPSPPQRIRGQQEGEPAKIKKKLHLKCLGLQWSDREKRSNSLHPVQLLKDSKDSTGRASDLGTWQRVSFRVATTRPESLTHGVRERHHILRCDFHETMRQMLSFSATDTGRG